MSPKTGMKVPAKINTRVFTFRHLSKTVTVVTDLKHSESIMSLISQVCLTHLDVFPSSVYFSCHNLFLSETFLVTVVFHPVFRRRRSPRCLSAFCIRQ